ncbi:unnamed protein product [Eruca vesicaria subsp. sativa]|uniref:Secreted protein n=1 Tax=Eruca vesicaria subsp. sativa TaxID=29727 RepID=A0ABC8LR99_ERUVS|nr:unnamed protein product [Eruca vesicaria subsp. sativa]
MTIIKHIVFLRAVAIRAVSGILKMKRIHTTTSLGKDTSSAKTTRMAGYISYNHGLWGCNKRLRGSKYGFTTMKTFSECQELKVQVRMLAMRVF